MKHYYTQYNVGRVRYAVSFHGGEKKHSDGSPFYDLRTFSNRRDHSRFIASLKKQGYVER